ncbi:helix-turn-helix domain-containing protein [Mesorhizobium sp. AR02]|uniref:helix-turn-helix domain-containing protein n=1 Tax=Mesorhizobium sp. AR02 TaxID=2865837 RepID=UPI00215EA10E|nr:helix-turn-helix transcriptional regulator [Mesorhizobium sp. AR02]UVK51287.1 helix-turn-helix domain-containing protein [Mesorhizobium sp. AR02]
MPKSVHSERHRMIAAALASQRRTKGLSQAEVAKVLGRHQPFVANIESGERRVDLVELMAIAKIIDLDVVALVRDLQDSPD